MPVPERFSDWKLWLLGALAGLLLVAAMAPAKAAACNSPIATKAGDGSIACVTTSPVLGPTLDFCDHDADTHKVYARFSDSVLTSSRYWTTSVNVLGPVNGYDPNGASSGCGHYRLLNGRFYAWAVCVQYEGCSGWARFPSYPVPTIPARVP